MHQTLFSSTDCANGVTGQKMSVCLCVNQGGWLAQVITAARRDLQNWMHGY